MAKAKYEKPVAGGTAAPDPAALENVANGNGDESSLPATRAKIEVGVMTGEVTARDIPIPYLNVAYGVGGLSTKFNPGDLVLDGEHLLVSKGTPLTAIIIAARIFWKEYLNKEMRENQVLPRSFDTEEEVHAAGGTTEWIDDVGPTFSKAANMIVLLKKPESVMCSYFSNKLGGNDWALARWNVDKSAFRRRGGRGVGPELMKACAHVLKNRIELPENKRILAGLWEIKTSVELINGNNTVVPNLALVGQNDVALVNEIIEKIKF